MTETAEYKSWLVNAPTNAALVEAVILEHPDWAASYYLVNWDTDLTLFYTDTAGSPVNNVFQAARFDLQQAPIEDSMAQSTRVAFTSADGAVHDEINNMTPDQRAKPIKLRVMQYMDTDLTKPLIAWPYPVWTVDAITSGFDTAVADLGVPQLRVRRIGRYFTRLEMPVLGYL